MVHQEEKQGAPPKAEGMAEGEKTADSASKPKAKKKGPILAGGIVGLVGLAYGLSIVALPAHHGDAPHRLGGPFVVDLSPSAGYQVNLAGDAGKHYLAMSIKVEVDAYDEAYATAGSKDPLYTAKLTDAVITVASQKTKDDLDDAVGKEVFREELRLALDPVLFPIHVGNEHEAHGRHEESGLRPGRSIARSTMRGPYFEHVLVVESDGKTIQLDDGPTHHYQGDETDLAVEDAVGRTLHVDVTELEPGFAGEIHVGALGRVRNVYFGNILTQ